MTDYDDEILPVTDLKSIGEILKNKREEHSFSLDHVAEVTRISLSNLRYIEEGNLEALPGPVFIRGFIRNYAKMLGLESDWMIDTLNQAYGTASQVSSGEESIFENEEADRNSTQTIALLAVVMIIIIGAGGWFWFGGTSEPPKKGADDTVQAVYNEEEAEPSTKQAVMEPDTTEEQKGEEVVEGQKTEETATETTDEAATTAEAAQEQVEEKEPEIKISPLNLVLMGKKEQWVRVTIDQGEAVEARLKVGQKYEWPAEKMYNLVMTTGGTATIYLNGEEIEVSKELQNQLYQTKLDKFSLTQLNN